MAENPVIPTPGLPPPGPPLQPLGPVQNDNSAIS